MKRVNFVPLLIVGTLSLLVKPALAQTGETPTSITGAKTISVADLKTDMGKVTIFDVRRRATFVEGHLPGAQSIVRHVDSAAQKCDAAAAFGSDKARPIVIHGHGTDGWSAFYCVKAAVEAGYTDVRWLRVGYAGWTEGGNPVAR